jgi:hypothetical protein
LDDPRDRTLVVTQCAAAACPAPLASIVIRVDGELETLAELLEHLEMQVLAPSKVELLVVDCSPDGDASLVARSRGARVVRAPNATPAEADNVGARRATARFVGFLDVHCLPPPDWASRAVRLLAHNPQVAACGAQYLAPTGTSRLQNALALGLRSSRPATGYLPSAGMFVDREAFEKLGGFPESEASSIDFCDRARVAGYDLLNEPAMAVLRMDEPMTLGALLLQEIRFARAVRVYYPGLGVAWVPLMAMLWWPCTVACLAGYTMTANPLLLASAFAGLVTPPLAIAARRGFPHARSVGDVALMTIVAATYLTGRVLGRFWPRS